MLYIAVLFLLQQPSSALITFYPIGVKIYTYDVEEDGFFAFSDKSYLPPLTFLLIASTFCKGFLYREDAEHMQYSCDTTYLHIV